SVFAVIGVIASAVAGFLGIFIAIDSFSCLHNKSVVDMRLSLPLTAAQRFFSNFLSGLTVYIGPFLAAQVVSLLGMAYGFIFMEGRTFQDFAGYDESGSIRYREYTCELFSIGMSMLLKLIIAGILVMLMLYTVTVLVTVCCGSKFESIAYTILINIMIPLTIYLVFMSMFQDLYGIDISDIVVRLIMFTSPAGGIVAAVGMAVGTNALISNFEMNYLVWGIVYFLITAAIGAGAFFLYKKRRAEQVSKPFVFKLLYYIISTAAIFCIYSVFYAEHVGIVPAILTTVIVYIIFEVAANRGFKKIWLSLIKYVGVMAASVLIIFAAQETEGFGMVTRVPTASQIKYVELNYGGFYGILHLPYAYTSSDIEKSLLSFSERENIETIISAHQKAVDDRGVTAKVGNSVEIRYHLKNGRTMLRRYAPTSAETAEILGRIDLTDEYKTQMAEFYKNKILNGKTSYLLLLENDSRLSNEVKYYLTETTQEYDDVSGGIRVSSLVDRNFFEQLAEAYAKDIMNITEENYYQSSAKNVYYLNTRYYTLCDITVPESFGNTLELLEYFGFDIFKKENMSDMELSQYFKDHTPNQSIRIYTAKEWRNICDVPQEIPLHGRYDVTASRENIVSKIDKDLCDLYRGAEPMNIVPDNGYIIYVFGRTWVIPEELNGTAARVYAGISENDDYEYDDYGNPFWLESTDEVIIPQEVPAGTTAYYVYD
ncbi:MAG: hypothetical protein K2K44_01035, partial [Oscillospiraceae bacterium]|nr:hypothetical protein [Oscillospiraceae bacterium]